MRHIIRRGLLGAGLIVAVAACTDASSTMADRNADLRARLSVSVLTPMLAPGTVGTLRIQNSSEARVLFGPCHIYFERLVGRTWVRLSTSDRVCAEVLHAVEAGSTLLQRIDLPSGDEAGRYRVALEFHVDEWTTRVLVHSDAFDTW